MERIKAFYPSDTEKITHVGKSGNIYSLDAIDQPVRIKEKLEADPRFEVVSVSGQDDSILLTSHSKDLISSYKSGSPLELSQSSGLLWNKDFYSWVVNKSWTTIDAVKEAIKSGKSIAITSGGHHAEFDHGHGFGPISNMVIAAKHLLNGKYVDRVAILDLDVHFANGTHSQVKGEKRILSCDIWRYRLPKWIYTSNSKNIYHKKVENTRDYSETLELMFQRIESFKPNLLFVYNGLDPLCNDRMGGVVGFDTQYLFARNKRVADFVKAHKLPVCVFIGGGYINYKQSEDKIEKSKVELTKSFVDSIATIFGV
ncbi:MAG: hypothetical protein AAB778_03845 [Patescibacteria group bacterium]